jgi:hypothetical protein
VDHKQFEMKERIIEGLAVGSQRDLTNVTEALIQAFRAAFKNKPSTVLKVGNSMVMVDDREGSD